MGIKHRSLRPRRRCGGFSIIEVAIAVTVLGSALVACCQLLQVARRAADGDQFRAMALNELERKVEMLNQTGFDLLQSKPRAPLPADSGQDCEIQTIVTQESSYLKKVRVVLYRQNSGGAEVQESAEFYVTDCKFPIERIW